MASGADRISALPEDVLHQVLRFLPAQEVVRTCVLARRWRRVWRSVPALRFTGAKGWGSADRFVQFVDHLLHLWRAGGDFGAPLDSCEFDFDLDGFMRLLGGEQHASRWIREAVSQVRALRVRVVEEQEASPLSDNLHLVSQHLTRLELIGVAVNDSVVDFSGCPALVHLNMEDCDVFVQQILSPSLKHLRIASCYTSEYYRILIPLPALVSLELIGFDQGRIPFLGSLPRLARAVAMRSDNCSDHCSRDRFDGCSSTGSEAYDGCYYYYGDPEDPEYGARRDRNNSVFLKGLSEATYLELSADSDVLTIQLSKVPPYVMETEGIYKPVGHSVASDCLKMVEIRRADVENRMHKILNTLTNYGIRLDQINIQHTSRIPGSGCFNFVCTGFS